MITFRKYQGTGNDFVVIDARATPLPGDAADLAIRLCDRRLGVGGDGILVIGPGEAGADVTLRIWNADGSGAEMCGNGLRCVVKDVLDAAGGEALTVATGAGVLRAVARRGADGRVATVRVAMGRPILDRAAIPLAGGGPGVREPLDHPAGRTFAFTGVSMGNPHAVIFVADEDPLALAKRFGPGLETHVRFPRKVNVEFVRPGPDGTFTVGVWERGAGLTAACGTGACACGVAACLEGRAQPGTPLTLHLPGGPLGIEVAPDFAQVYLEGPATLVYAGSVDPAALPPAEACLRLQSALA